MDALIRKSPTAAYIADNLGDDVFTVIDVGCSGGHMPGWRALGAHLRAFAFDPQRFEIARLRAAETNPLCEYIEGYVGAPADHPLRLLHTCDVYWARSPWWRLSAARTHALAHAETPEPPTRFDHFDETVPDLDIPLLGVPAALAPMAPEDRTAVKPDTSAAAPVIEEAEAARQLELQEQNLWAEADLADEARQIVLPDYLRGRGVTDIDFLKIDVDGPDYDILYTMSATLSAAHILGVSLEVNFNGSHLPHHHTFHNMDRFMRAHGFTLFALTSRTYSSAALPQPYEMPHPAQTIKGRPLQGDALYLRDFGLALPGRESDVVSDEKLAKTAALFAMFDLPAEGVEHLLRFKDRLSRLFDVDRAVELLTQESQRDEQTAWTYAEYVAAFDRGDPFFLNRQLAPEYDPVTKTGAHPLDTAQALARQAQAEAQSARAEVEALKAELETLRASSLSGGLRGALRSLRGGR
ncbi:hypothetical protein BH09PSE2_BH09PSE2_07890 [soil metagenome]